MLIAEAAGVGFRHELARLAVEESVPPHRKVGLHRRALAALADPPVGAPDLARLAHHAEAAGDVDAVLRFAPAAGARAASLGAYREAAAQYARALRVGDRLSAAQRAELLECRRQLGQRLEEGDSLRWLSKILWCPGRITESERAAREAVTLLEALPPGRELAIADANLASTSSAAARSEEAVRWARRALEYGLATRHLQEGLDYCSDRGLERDRLYLLAYRARLELDQGRWEEASDSAAAVLRIPCTSIMPRILALVVLALVRARRGDPGRWEPLEAAWALAEPTGELPRLAPVATASAEAVRLGLAGRDL